MTHAEVVERVKGTEYDFLRDHPNLGENILLLTVAGSRAYGTEVEGSDLDIRGVTSETAKELLGTSKFEQVDDKATDTVVYGLNKATQMFLNSNPNLLEVLGTRDEDLLILTDQGKRLRDNRKLFLSQKASVSYGGFAFQQLMKIHSLKAKCDNPLTNSMKNRKSLWKTESHYLRVLECGIHLFEHEDLLVHTNDCADLLVAIKQGLVEYEEVIDRGVDLERRMAYALKNTSLPVEPDYNKVEELVMSIHSTMLKRKGW